MSDVRRLLNQPADSFERSLLESLAEGDMPEAARARAAAALGIGAVAVASTTAATTSVASASAGAKAATAGGVASISAKVGMSVVAVKWSGVVLATAAIAGASVGGGITIAKKRAVVKHTAVFVASPSPASPSASPLTHEVFAPSIEAVPAVTVDSLPKAPVAKALPPSPPAVENAGNEESMVPEKAVPSSPARLDEEVRELEKARVALSRGDVAAALAALNAHAEAFSHGSLADEAEALRIEALMRAGNQDEAKARGEAFLSAHPNSSLAARVRRAIKK